MWSSTHHIARLDTDNAITAHALAGANVHYPWQGVHTKPVEQWLALLELNVCQKEAATGHAACLQRLLIAEQWCVSTAIGKAGKYAINWLSSMANGSQP